MSKITVESYSRHKETPEELNLLRDLAQRCESISEYVREKYFRHSFRILMNSGKRVALGVNTPTIESLVPGICNIPAALTMRSRLYNRSEPCKVLKTTNKKQSNRFFCHHHEDFAMQHGLPIVAQGTEVMKNLTRPRKRKRLDTEPVLDKDVMDIDNNALPIAIDQCEFYYGCTNTATEKGFCESHLLASNCIDTWSHNDSHQDITLVEQLEHKINMLQHALTSFQKGDVIEPIIDVNDIHDHEVKLIRNLFSPQIHFKAFETTACHLISLLNKRALKCRQIGIGTPSSYDSLRLKYIGLIDADILELSLTN